MSEARNTQTFPLSLSQREVWLEQHTWPNSPHMNIGGFVLLHGLLDVACLQSALTRLVDESDALRLAPGIDGDQIRYAAWPCPLEIIDFSNADDALSGMENWFQHQMATPFEFDETPPWRCSLLCGDTTLHALTIRSHHLVLDGWGISLVVQRLAVIYAALREKRPTPPSPALDFHLAIDESTRYQQSPALKADQAFWQATLRQIPPALIVPRNPSEQAGTALPKAHLIRHSIPGVAYQQLADFTREAGVSLFTLFATVLAIYFSGTKNRSDILIGVPTLNRSGKKFAGTPGMFANVFPLLVEVKDEDTLLTLIKGVSQSIRSALRHSRYPISQLKKGLAVAQQKRNGLIDLILSYERYAYPTSFGDAKLTNARQFFSQAARYPLAISICQYSGNDDVELVIEASSACFSRAEASLLSRRLVNLLFAAVNAKTSPIRQLPLIPDEERWALIDGLHERCASRDKIRPFTEQFEHHASLQPNAPALLWDGGELNYRQLQERILSVAARLHKMGIGPGDVIGLAIGRSPELIIGLFAIARAGAAFLPLDPETPPLRNIQLLHEAGARAVLTTENHQAQFVDLEIPAISLAWEQIERHHETSTLPAAPLPNDLAYIMFTSGSTGRPKGIMVEHAALARRLAWIANAFNITPADRAGQICLPTFDPALIEIVMPLMQGASVALPLPGVLSANQLGDFAIRQRVTFMAFVPTTLGRFLDGIAGKDASSLRVACCGGAALSSELASRFIRQSGARLFNLYGPTETVIFATAWLCEDKAGGSAIPVGHAVDDTRVYVLDAELNPMPFGETGEIYIGGRAIARGYIKLDESTQPAFLPDPFLPGEKLYRTGDCGYVGTDGNLYFTGRKDRQIKLRGYRIEPGEIEAHLLALPGITEAAVKPGEHNGKMLLFAWVAAADSLSNASILQKKLRHQLPDYMMPAHIQILPHLPHCSSGKIDYAALLLPEESIAEPIYREPRNHLESEILKIWEIALDRRPISVTDDFFKLGGDSLSAIDILAGLEKTMGKKVSLFVLTENPTIEQLAATLGEEGSHARLIWLLSDRSDGVPLYLAASGHGDLLRFQRLAEQLGSDYSVFMLQPPRSERIENIQELARHYAREILNQGAIAGFIAGFSAGGITALETARLLQERGISMRGLVLLDTVYPAPAFYKRKIWRWLSVLARTLRVENFTLNGRRIGATLGDAGLEAQVQALENYVPTEYGGRVLLVKSNAFRLISHWMFRPWKKVMTEHLTEIEVHGIHGSMFEAAHVGDLAKALDAYFHSTVEPSIR